MSAADPTAGFDLSVLTRAELEAVAAEYRRLAGAAFMLQDEFWAAWKASCDKKDASILTAAVEAYRKDGYRLVDQHNLTMATLRTPAAARTN